MQIILLRHTLLNKKILLQLFSHKCQTIKKCIVLVFLIEERLTWGAAEANGV